MTEYLGLICLAGSIAVFGCCLALVGCRKTSGVGRRYIPDDGDRVHRTWKPPVVAITIENFYPMGASNGWSSAWSSVSSYTTKNGQSPSQSPAPSPQLPWGWISSPSVSSSVDIQYVPSEQIIVAKL